MSGQGWRRALMRGLACGVLLLAAGPVAVTIAHPNPGSLIQSEGELEAVLARVVSDIESARIERALTRLEALIESHPDFRLAHLIKGDLLASRAQPLEGFGNGAAGRDREALLAEARARINAHRHGPGDLALPRNLVQLGEHQDTALVVDAQASRLYVFGNEGGRPRLLRDYYISQGKAGFEKAYAGDNRTPLGVYRITEQVPRSKLTEFYGAGAFALNYPNEWDRQSGRSGSGIWLHGTPPGTYSRPPRASQGCVVIANRDLASLEKYLEPGNTPIVISPHVEWVSSRAWTRERDALLAQIEQWRHDRESAEPAGASAHYAERLQKSLAGRAPARLRLTNITLLRDPAEDLFVASFEQDATTDAGTQRTRVQQYWLREKGQWKIVFEG